MHVEHVRNKCCGCRACEQKCKHEAITFINDEYGFEYPHIDAEKCVNCAQCESVCPIMNAVGLSESLFGAVAYARDNKTRYNGSSGGLFGVFAEDVIKRKGAVFGAAFDDNLVLKTQKAETLEELVPLYKSKYLLCDTRGQFDAIEGELKKGRSVLYCSSPCQIAALKLYLKKEYDNLLTIDFICHGVGSQSLFDKSIAWTEKKAGIKIKEVILRYKKSRASSHYYCYRYLKDGEFHEKTDLYFSFPYYNAYCKRLACRDSCYACQFASRHRAGDITIGDFHSIENYRPDIDRFAGVSMLLVNTLKGKRYFDSIKASIYWDEIDKEVLYKNNRFSGVESVTKHQSEFRKSVASEPFETTVKKFLSPSKDLKKLIYYKSPEFLRKAVLKLFGMR